MSGKYSRNTLFHIQVFQVVCEKWIHGHIYTTILFFYGSCEMLIWQEMRHQFVWLLSFFSRLSWWRFFSPACPAAPRHSLALPSLYIEGGVQLPFPTLFVVCLCLWCPILTVFCCCTSHLGLFTTCGHPNTNHHHKTTMQKHLQGLASNISELWLLNSINHDHIISASVLLPEPDQILKENRPCSDTLYETWFYRTWQEECGCLYFD